MKKLFYLSKGILLLLFLGYSLTGCSNEPILSTREASLKTSVADKSGTNHSNQFHFNASINGKNSVPAKDTKAVGEVIVNISKNESTVHYKVMVANIKNVVASHFHLAPAGSNGKVVVPLFANPNPQPSGPMNGIMAEGDITASDVFGELAGDLDGFIEAIRSGNIYINIHTMDNPAGEIRGQL
jgi:hypothetical protein